MTKNNFILLGGSNSILKNGLQKGISDNSSLKNYSLGASSSLQNLYELCRNNEEINESDYIVSESNINDYHTAGLLDSMVPINTVNDNICLYYHHLSEFKNKTLVILLPMTIDNSCRDIIYNTHLSQIKKHGFHYIDLHALFKKNNLLQFCDDHLPSDLMFEFGRKITKLLKEKKQSKHTVTKKTRDNLILWSPNSSKENKKNSLLNEYVIQLIDNKKYQIPPKYANYKIRGLHCWNDKKNGNPMKSGSGIKISNNKETCIKHFNSECQFHDLHNPITVNNNTFIENSYCSSTENSTRVRFIKPNLETKLISLFLVKETNYSEPEPEPEPMRINCTDDMFLSYYLSFLIYERDRVTDFLRDSALDIEKENINFSIRLMEKALSLRPNGPFIKGKLKEYLGGKN